MSPDVTVTLLRWFAVVPIKAWCSLLEFSHFAMSIRKMDGTNEHEKPGRLQEGNIYRL